MPIYTEADFERMEHDPIFRRRYFWSVGQAALRRAATAQRKNRWTEAEIEEAYGRLVLDNIDLMVGER